jgi:hypothetical protein
VTKAELLVKVRKAAEVSARDSIKYYKSELQHMGIYESTLAKKEKKADKDEKKEIQEDKDEKEDKEEASNPA